MHINNHNQQYPTAYSFSLGLSESTLDERYL